MTASDSYGNDVYTEPDGDPDTLANLGPLRPMAGIFEGVSGADVHPIDAGFAQSDYTEHYESYPTDFQTNGPQLFYPLRYHTNILEVGSPAMFHDQVGYWLWEPAARSVSFTLGIPRGQVLIAMGDAEPDATEFELHSSDATPVNGIVSNPFLYRAFRTLSFRIHVTINDDDTWSYEQDSVLEIPGRDIPFHHTDAHTLRRIAPATPNPLARVITDDSSLGIGSLRQEKRNLP